ncbi:MAG: glycine cleavage system protein H [Proteobacteria bacterium]|nr:glycine cleavage system protein H [Pseudomonadota bacterium]
MSILLALGMAMLIIGGAQLAQRWRRGVAADLPVRSAPEPMRRPFVPSGVFVSSSHGWLAFDAGAGFRVGLDSFLVEALGQVDAIELPPVGVRVAYGEALLTLRVAGRRVVVAAPTSGEVVGVNELARAAPRHLLDDPYGLGWLVRIMPSDHKAALEPLYVGPGATAFLRRELRRMVDWVNLITAPAGVPQLSDGGLPQRGVAAQLGDEQLVRFAAAFMPCDEGEGARSVRTQ